MTPYEMMLFDDDGRKRFAHEPSHRRSNLKRCVPGVTTTRRSIGVSPTFANDFCGYISRTSRDERAFR